MDQVIFTVTAGTLADTFANNDVDSPANTIM
jgi:hypothetical protein